MPPGAPRDGRLGAVGAFVLAASAGALLALMVIGLAATATLGLEPAWLAFPLEVAGYAFLAGAALRGAACGGPKRRLGGPRSCYGEPTLGLGLDAATNLLPFGELFFFADSGSTSG